MYPLASSSHHLSTILVSQSLTSAYSPQSGWMAYVFINSIKTLLTCCLTWSMHPTGSSSFVLEQDTFRSRHLVSWSHEHSTIPSHTNDKAGCFLEFLREWWTPILPPYHFGGQSIEMWICTQQTMRFGRDSNGSLPTKHRTYANI